MKNFLDKPKTPIFVAVLAIFVLAILSTILIFNYVQASSNLSKQQQWSSGKENFDNAFAIAASVKDVPDKNLYVPKLIEQIGTTIPQCVASIGHGAVETSVEQISDPSKLITEKHIINLNDEAGNAKAGTPSIWAYTGPDQKIVKISFTCNAFLLGYGNLSFIDLINNEHAIEKAFNEAGLALPYYTVIAPQNRSSYTQYASDGTTVVSENCDFSGSIVQDKRKYNWEANVKFNYDYANQKGNLADTIRTITITISAL